MAADGPQVLEGSPQQDNEETSKEGDHGGGQESPPHPLAVAVAGHVGREGDDEVHLGDVDGRVWVELLPALGHFAELVVVVVVVVGHLPASTQPTQRSEAASLFRRFEELRVALPGAPEALSCLARPPAAAPAPSAPAATAGRLLASGLPFTPTNGSNRKKLNRRRRQQRQQMKEPLRMKVSLVEVRVRVWRHPAIRVQHGKKLSKERVGREPTSSKISAPKKSVCTRERPEDSLSPRAGQRCDTRGRVPMEGGSLAPASRW